MEIPISDFDTTKTAAAAAAVAAAATITSPRQIWLPWGSHTRSSIAATAGIFDMPTAGENMLRPGEIVMRTLFADFTQQSEKKIETVMMETSVSAEGFAEYFGLAGKIFFFILSYRIKTWPNSCNAAKTRSSTSSSPHSAQWPSTAFLRCSTRCSHGIVVSSPTPF